MYKQMNLNVFLFVFFLYIFVFARACVCTCVFLWNCFIKMKINVTTLTHFPHLEPENSQVPPGCFRSKIPKSPLQSGGGVHTMTFHFCITVSSVYLVWKGLFVFKNIMSMIFEFLHFNKLHSIWNLSSFSPLSSHFSVSFQLLFVYKRRGFTFTAGRQKFPTRVCVGKQREKDSTRD